MRDAIGIGAVLLIFTILMLRLIPGLPNYDANCPDSKPVIIDKVFSGCTGDSSQTAGNMWIPEGKPAKMQPCKWCEEQDKKDAN